jgi:hypothetical protein
MRGAIPSLPQYVFIAWCLVKHRELIVYLAGLLALSLYICTNSIVEEVTTDKTKHKGKYHDVRGVNEGDKI